MSNAKKPGQEPEPLPGEAPLKKHEALSEALTRMYQAAGDPDEIPGGLGEFGHAPGNPIPTQSPIDSTRYLARLRLPSGERVHCKQTGSLASNLHRRLIDRFEISSLQGVRLATLYLSHYYDRTSEKAPNGFLLELD